MTTVNVASASAPAIASPLRVRDWKVTIMLGIVALISVLLFIVFGRDGSSTFSFSVTQTDVIALPTVNVPARGFGTFAAIVALLMAAFSARYVLTRHKIPRWYIALFAFILVIAFLAWATVGHTLHITGLLAGSLALSVPLIFGALGGVVSERTGVVNIAIEGQLLAGAFIAAVVTSTTKSVIAGLIAAGVAGVLVSFVLAAFAIRYFVDQVIVGVVLNVLVLGLTNFLYSTTLVPDASTLNSPMQLQTIAIPGLSAIPVIGPVLFNQTIIVYLMYVAVAAVFFGLFYTRWGLRSRSVGEHPQAADTVGINVNSMRFWNVSLAGAIVGVGGAYFTIGSVGAFSQDVTSGAGYIALAAVIFGRWDPLRATLAALLFGFASDLQSVLGILGSPVPSDFLLMLPYVVTIIAVAGLVGQSRAPGADGKPYFKS